MVKNIPPKLYKFQALDKEGHSIQNLKRNQLWFPKPAELNDPFDLEIPFVLDWTDEDFEKFYEVNLDKRNIQSQSQATAIKETFFVNGKPKQSWKDHIYEIFENQMRQRINNEISKLGVACFTEDNLDNILMWSHYANGHKGFCLEFDTNYAPFLDTEQLRRVIYSEKYPSLPFSYYLKDESEGIPDDILRTKSLNWKYENEWRLILDVGGIVDKIL